MTKKYNQPEVLVAMMAAMSMICASGGETPSGGEGFSIGAEGIDPGSAQ